MSNTRPPKSPKPTFQNTAFAVDTRRPEWENLYAQCDVAAEQKIRLQETEYRSVIDVELAGLQSRGITKPKCLELACGTAPWTAYLAAKGFDVTCSDYSETVVDRLHKEFGFKAAAADISDLHRFEDQSFDLVIMAGAIYENPDPYFVSRVYPEIARVLVKNGVFIQFCNRYLNFSNRFFSRKANILGNLHPRSWNFLRRLLGKPLVTRAVLFWLMPLDLVAAFGAASKLKTRSIYHFQQEVGLRELLFFLPLFKNKQLYSQESAYPARNEIFQSWFLSISNALRQSKSANVTRACGIVFDKE